MGINLGYLHFEYIPKRPGHKFTLWWGREGQITLYVGTKTHPWGKLYFFRDGE